MVVQVIANGVIVLIGFFFEMFFFDCVFVSQHL